MDLLAGGSGGAFGGLLELLSGVAVYCRLGSFWPVVLGLVSDDISLRRVLGLRFFLSNHNRKKKSRLEVFKAKSWSPMENKALCQ